jgi:serine/threonine protein kinase
MPPLQTIAHYRITAKLGEGGMGEVWRATDTKLSREVALKILPARFAQDTERTARFEREARVLASLNHPHIAQIYGIEERALVMELVEGETLKGPLPLDTALEYARQVADALEAAHDKGIVHRDLKPGNIMVTPAGVVKVLDFGLARVADEISTDSTHSPTRTISPTRAGVILGTAPYMSPEQARGKLADKRADIWAFGCVLYEMLTGKPAFSGETTTDILAAVVKTEPDLAQVPAGVRRLLAASLEKDPKKRLQAIGDWRLLLEDTASGAKTGSIRSSAPWIAVAAVLSLLAILGWYMAWRASRPVDHPLTRLNVDLGPQALTGLNTTIATSPDGRRLVFPHAGRMASSNLPRVCSIRRCRPCSPARKAAAIHSFRRIASGSDSSMEGSSRKYLSRAARRSCWVPVGQLRRVPVGARMAASSRHCFDSVHSSACQPPAVRDKLSLN